MCCTKYVFGLDMGLANFMARLYDFMVMLDTQGLVLARVWEFLMGL